MFCLTKKKAEYKIDFLFFNCVYKLCLVKCLVDKLININFTLEAF